MKDNRMISWDSHLLKRAAAGDQVAFEILVDAHRPMLMNLANRMLRNSEDAADAVQDTIVKALRAIGDFDTTRPLKPWLCRICANCCVDAVRDRRRAGEPLENHEYLLTDEDEHPDDSAAESIAHGQVLAAIDRLPDRYREIVQMRHFRHMDVVEIAKALDKPEGTIKSWLFRARAMLKKDLAPALGL
ncbi:sigma-70 family RNA polymerase sigma factor [bacterium]|nr:MAG: sigma-70 family RNA polymerase sigma factor [bacterium]